MSGDGGERWERPATLTDAAILEALVGVPLFGTARLKRRLAGVPGVSIATDDDLHAAAEIANRIVRTMLSGEDEDWNALRRAQKALDSRTRAARDKERTWLLVTTAWALVVDPATPRQRQALSAAVQRARSIANHVRGKTSPIPREVKDLDLIDAAGKGDAKRGKRPSAEISVGRVYALLSKGFPDCWPSDRHSRAIRGKLGRMIRDVGLTWSNSASG